MHQYLSTAKRMLSSAVALVVYRGPLHCAVTRDDFNVGVGKRIAGGSVISDHTNVYEMKENKHW